jgi:hypothetical protein
MKDTCSTYSRCKITFNYKIASQVALLWPSCLHLLHSRITVDTLLGLRRFLLGLSEVRGLGGIKFAPALKSTVSMSGIGKIVPEYVNW